MIGTCVIVSIWLAFFVRLSQERCQPPSCTGPNPAIAFPPKDGLLAPGHCLVAPLGHSADLCDVGDEALNATMLLVKRLTQAMGATLEAGGLNVMNASGPHSEQSVSTRISTLFQGGRMMASRPGLPGAQTWSPSTMLRTGCLARLRSEPLTGGEVGATLMPDGHPGEAREPCTQ